MLDWKKIGSGDDIVYVASKDGEKVATVYRGGDRWYPWSVSMPGRRIGNQTSLKSAKLNIERLHRAGPPERPSRPAGRTYDR